MLSLSTVAAPIAALRPRLDALVYRAETGRDLRIDFLRGFAVFAMVIDHLAGPSRLYMLTGGNRFFTSAAEGFVFISGLMVGLAYRRMAERDGLGPTLRRLIERAWQLYVLTIGLTLVMLPVSELLNLPWARGVDLSNPPALAWNILTLRQTYYLVDIPLLYALLLVFAPFAFLLMYERRTWVVLLASWALWAGHQLFPEQSDIPWPISGNYLFSFPAWQVLFFTAMVLGFHRDRIQATIPSSWRRPLLLACGLGFAGLLVIFRYADPVLRALAAGQEPSLQAGQSLEATLVEVLFAKGDVRLGRVVASAIVFGFFFLLTTEFWAPLRRGLGWLLLPLGQNALYAYSAHIAIAVAIALFSALSGLPFPNSPGANAVVQLASIGLIWLAIRGRVLNPSRTNRRYWMASPLALIVAFVLVLPLDPSPELPGLAPHPTVESAAYARAARVFGTPVTRIKPREVVQEAVQAIATPVPLPPPPAAVRTPAPLPAGEPRVSEYVGAIKGSFRELQFYSAALDRDMSYFVYLPPRYATAGRRYPVLYMLHGGSGDKEEWPAYGLIDTVDELIVGKEIRPLLVVLPQGEYSYWVNYPDDGPRWADYVANDLVRHIDSSFRTLPSAEHRAIGGLSMGAHGALQLAFNYPHVFRAAGSHSPSLYEEDWLPMLGNGADYAARDPISLAASAPGLDQLQLWIDIGEEDPWLERAELLHETLATRGIDHEWNVLPGGHDGEYWQRNLVTYLRFFYDRVLNWRYVP
ncbi:MAG: OpgC domain-containing protein [Chloroflexi bacterium]|nr:OpgC domain-containing protein [Chloroflexota bacterium]